MATCAWLVAGLLLAGDSPAEAAQKEAERLQGAWVRVAAEAGGRALSADELKRGPKLVIGPDGYALQSPTETRKGVMKFDPTKSPRTIDIIPSEGPNKGKVMPGIYELTGDRFRYVFDPTGKQRPTEFRTTPGSGLMMYDNRREK
jgi:uncharacterized protein (TIGR03067 family)